MATEAQRKTRPAPGFERSVFISSPPSGASDELFQAVVFAVQIAGFIPRSTLEVVHAGQAHLERIMAIIAECRFGVHDISRTELGVYDLPAFNLPFELGLDLACSRYGTGALADKKVIVFDRKAYRYQRFLSDLVGYPIYSHSGKPLTLLRRVGDWLKQESKDKTIPSGRYMASRYHEFRAALPDLFRRLRLSARTLSLGDYSTITRVWLEENEA
jgi:hypothetical protein